MSDPYRTPEEEELIVIEKMPTPWRGMLAFLAIGLMAGFASGVMFDHRYGKTTTITKTVEVIPAYKEGDPCFDEIVKVSFGAGKCPHPKHSMKWDSDLGSIHCACHPSP